MDLTYSQENEAFRAQVQTWVATNFPPRDKSLSNLPMDDPQRLRQAKDWQCKLYEAGYVAMSWPKEAGVEGSGLESGIKTPSRSDGEGSGFPYPPQSETRNLVRAP